MAQIRVFLLQTEAGKVCINADNDQDAEGLLAQGAVELPEETVREVFGDDAAYASPDTVHFAEDGSLVFHKDKSGRSRMELASLKRCLSDTDYAIIKIAEGAASAADYADVIEQRRAWRSRINELESMIGE